MAAALLASEYLSETARRVTDGSGRVIEYRYDPSGLFAGITTGLGHAYNMTYSPAVIAGGDGERTVTRTDPLGRTVVTELNAFNQPVRLADAAGRVLEFTYEPNFQGLASVEGPSRALSSFRVRRARKPCSRD